MILWLLACSGEGKAPLCETFTPEPWDPVWEDDVRLDDTTAAWEGTGDAAIATKGKACDGPCLAVTGEGGASTTLRVNRMAEYHLVGTLSSDTRGTIAVRHTSTEGVERTVWEGEVEAGTLTIDETFQIVPAGPDLRITVSNEGEGTTTLDGFGVVGQRWAATTDPATGPVRLGFVIHVEEEDFVGDEENYRRKATVLGQLSQTLAAHGAKLTIQADTAFIRGATVWEPEWVSDRQAEGAGFSVHVHDESASSDLEQAFRDGKVTTEEAGAATTDINGGFNFAPWLDMYRAGYRSLTAYKKGEDQSGLPRVQLEPWRPTDGVGSDDPEGFMEHDPEGPLVYLPGYDTREADHARFPDASARVLGQVLAHVRPDYVSTWYFVLHVDGFVPEYGGDIDDYLAGELAEDLAFYDAFLSETVDPLVDDGSVIYATTPEMYAAWAEWAAECED